MSIDAIKETFGQEMEKASKSPHFKTMSSLLDKVVNLLHNPHLDHGRKMAWENVDMTIKPEMYVVTGTPSSGKSTWLDNVMLNDIRLWNQKWAIFSPESHPLEQHMKKLIEIYTKTNFEGLYFGKPTEEHHIKKTIQELNDKLFMMTPTGDNLKIEKILELAAFLIETYGVQNIIIDPYNEFSHTRDRMLTETEYVSQFLGDIRRFINKHRVSVWIVAHPTKMKMIEMTFADGSKGEDYPAPTAYDIAGSANFFNKPDNIISIYRDKSLRRNPENFVSVHVQKVRWKTTGRLGSYALKHDYKYGTYDDAPEFMNGGN